MKKSNKGFTLVELIVVIAIIGILAAILVPALVGYIKDSKLTSANSSAKTIYTAVNNYCQKCLTNGTPVPAGSKTYALSAGDGTDPTYNGNDIKKAISNSLNADSDGSVAYVKIGTNNFPEEVKWAKGSTDPYVGSYPTAATDTSTALGAGT